MKILKSLSELECLSYKGKFKISKIEYFTKTKDDFFKNTFAVFKKIDKSFEKKADFISYSNGHYYNDGDELCVNGKGDVSSMYWYTEEGVYRLSNHWGKCSTCCWLLSEDNSFKKLEENINENYERNYGVFQENILGFCAWKDFFNLIEKELKDLKEEEFFIAYDFGYSFFDKKGINSVYSEHPNHQGETINMVESLKIEIICH